MTKTPEQILDDVKYLLGDLRFELGCLQARSDFKYERAKLCKKIEDIQDVCSGVRKSDVLRY